MISFAEYIWLDGTQPTQELRSKTRTIHHDRLSTDPKDYPTWTFDGSSTYQATGKTSDLLIVPVRVIKDPIRGNNNVLVLAEVCNQDHTPHKTNTRSKLCQVLANGADSEEALLGFEQEYTLFDGANPLGWPEIGTPKPQGPYYCGVGADKAFGREVVEKHMQYCIDAGLCIYGVNAEVMPGQWEYQIGYRGFKDDTLDALTICDHQMLARWLLCRTAEAFGIVVSFDNKPIKGDWNGSGCHTNFSTKSMRDPKKGYDIILDIIDRLAKKHDQHIKFYGHNLHERLTGLHETCSITQFRYGISDRGASIRIPINVKEQGCGYLEDRRPGANADPYLVTACLLTTTCNLSWDWAENSNHTQSIKV